MLKERLGRVEVLTYYCKDARTQAIADASSVGLGAVLMQHQTNGGFQCTVQHGSPSDVERRYSQTEKEAPAPMWHLRDFESICWGKSLSCSLTTHILRLSVG